MISINQLSIRAKDNFLLQNIKLEIKIGFPLTIIGESGAGKSTLVQAILGHHCGVASGEICVNGHNILEYNSKQLRHYRRHQIAMLSQSTAEALNPQLTVMQHLLESLHNKKNSKQSQQTVEQQLVACKVPPNLWYRRPKGLSGGEIQRVLLAIALINKPSILVLDEPDSALDGYLRQQLRQQIISLAPRHYVIWVSHDLHKAKDMVGNVAVLHQGKLVEYNSVESLFHSPKTDYTKKLLVGRLPVTPPIVPKLDYEEETKIQVKNLSKTYAGKVLLHNLNFSLNKGEIVALFGVSGIGKSTLARLLCGLSSPDTGSIDYYPKNMSVAWVSQHPIRALPPFFTLFNAVAEPLVLQKCDKQHLATRVVSALEQVKIEPSPKNLKQRISSFSGGELQRIALARALIGKPQVIIADEITANLDSETSREIINLLLKKQQQGLSVLFITHDETLGRHIAQRCFTLYDGEFNSYSSPQKLPA